MATKLSILTERRDQLRKELDEAESYLKGLAETVCGLRCAGCDTFLATEEDFAAHFTVSDERFLNLGNCPKGDKR
jgi:hypothetical protein